MRRFLSNPRNRLRSRRDARVRAGIQGRRHRGRKAVGASDPEGRRGGRGYLVIRNAGAAPDRLTGGSADFATVEIHETKSDGGVTQMRELKDGLNVPAHGSVGLSPGGTHLMFTHLAHPLIKGEAVKATLTFEHAGPVEVEFKVMGVGASGGGMSGGGMGGMKM